MRIIRHLAVLALVLGALEAFGQNEALRQTPEDTMNISFRDTVFQLAFDSISNNHMELLPPEMGDNRLVKHFKYIGTDTLYISRAWTSDPNYICDYPRELLIPGKIYSFTVCFYYKDIPYRWSDTMGFYLSDGNRVTLKFSGTFLPSGTIRK